MKRSTNLIVISGPSGAGKDAVIDGLFGRGLPLGRVITTTSRDIRAGESQNNPYYFVGEEEFSRLIANGEMLEHAEVFGKKYGVTKKEIERVKKMAAKTIIWKIDWQGVANVKNLIPDILAIFIMPPSPEILAERLAKRGRETKKQILARLNEKEWKNYNKLADYQVVNAEGKLEETINKVAEILNKEGCVL